MTSPPTVLSARKALCSVVAMPFSSLSALMMMDTVQGTSVAATSGTSVSPFWKVSRFMKAPCVFRRDQNGVKDWRGAHATAASG
jgi:hypothetical protein